MKAAPGVHKYQTAWAISSGFPNRPTGTALSSCAMRSPCNPTTLSHFSFAPLYPHFCKPLPKPQTSTNRAKGRLVKADFRYVAADDDQLNLSCRATIRRNHGLFANLHRLGRRALAQACASACAAR